MSSPTKQTQKRRKTRDAKLLARRQRKLRRVEGKARTSSKA